LRPWRVERSSMTSWSTRQHKRGVESGDRNA